MIVTCPAASGVTTPAALTVAIDGGFVVHDPVIVRPSDAVAVICSTRPKKTLLFGEVTPTEKFETGGDAFPTGVDAVGEESLPQAIVEVRAAHTRTLLSISILSEECPTGQNLLRACDHLEHDRAGTCNDFFVTTATAMGRTYLSILDATSECWTNFKEEVVSENLGHRWLP
jgi:hypothetical protein